MLFFVLLAYIPTGAIREKAIGTVKIVTDFFLMNLIVQLIFLGITYISKYFTDYWVHFISIGNNKGLLNRYMATDYCRDRH